MPDGDTWYFERDNQQHGPIPFHELKRMANSGALQRTQLVWTTGMADWAAAETVGGLFPERAAPLIAEPLEIIPEARPSTTPISAPPVEIEYYGCSFEPDYAGFWLRLVACVIDGLVVWVAHLLMFMVPWWLATETNPRLVRHQNLVNMVWAVAMIVVSWLYFAGMESSSRQATIGKAALRLKVTDLRGKRISLARASGRFFGKFVSYFPVYIGFIIAGVTPRKQALHDLIASTLVICR